MLPPKPHPADTVVPRKVTHSGRMRWKRWIMITASASVLVMVAVSVVGIATISNAFDKIRRVALGDLGDRPSAPTGANSPINILLIGSDTRAGDNAEYGTHVDGERGDVTIVLHISGDRKSASAISIPRDSMVELPSCIKHDGSQLDPRLDMFNAAYAYGGPTCTIRAVERLTGVYIHHFVVVDFEGFKQMVDALGTVSVCLPRSVSDHKSKLYLSAGRHEVDGETALAYVRNRTLDDSGDVGRMKRQQMFLAAMLQKASSAGILANPPRLVSFLNATASSMTTDEGFGQQEMLSIAKDVKGIGLNKITFFTVPTQEYPPNPNRLEWTQAAEDLWRAVRNDSSIVSTKRPSAGTSTTTPTPSSTITGITPRPADQDVCD